MKRFLGKIGRFFWSWGFLKFVLGMILLIFLLYAEEDWRGAHAWAVTKAKWEARGESFDYAKLIPPPVPDEENLAALPLFKMEYAIGFDGKKRLEPVTLQKAVRSGEEDINLPSLGNWQAGALPDLNKIRATIAEDYEKVFKTAPDKLTPLAQMDALFPVVGELREASKTRPYCRFDLDYTSQPPYLRSFSLAVAPISLSRVIVLHAVLALTEDQSALALEDLKLNAKLSAAVSCEPTLVSGLVAEGLNAIAGSAVYFGLALHAWNDSQLAALQDNLAGLQPLTNYQLAMRGEFVGFSLPAINYFKKQRPDISAFFEAKDDDSSSVLSRDLAYTLWPNGWLDHNASMSADAQFGAVACVDPEQHRVYPDRVNQLQENVRHYSEHWYGWAPWNIFYAVATNPLLNATFKFSEAQVWLDHEQIACALERYHLAHGNYPNSLDALTPAYIHSVPHDIMNGEPYHYRLQNDGSFLLYSVGWNQKDDGGVAVVTLPQPSDPHDDPKRHGDWVWPTPKSGN